MLEVLKRPVGYVLLMVLSFISASVALAVVDVAVTWMRGYQLITLKTRMYWENGEAVVGDKVKTWKIAIPRNIWLVSYRSWGIYSGTPVYSRRLEDFGTDRYVSTLTQLNSNMDVIAYTPRAPGAEFVFVFSNAIPNADVDFKKPIYKRRLGMQPGCIAQDNTIDYHGWVVGVSPINLTPEQKCAIVTRTLDRWTLHIDDLLSKDSGNQETGNAGMIRSHAAR